MCTHMLQLGPCVDRKAASSGLKPVAAGRGWNQPRSPPPGLTSLALSWGLPHPPSNPNLHIGAEALVSDVEMEAQRSPVPPPPVSCLHPSCFLSSTSARGGGGRAAGCLASQQRVSASSDLQAALILRASPHRPLARRLHGRCLFCKSRP